MKFNLCQADKENAPRLTKGLIPELAGKDVMFIIDDKTSSGRIRLACEAVQAYAKSIKLWDDEFRIKYTAEW